MPTVFVSPCGTSILTNQTEDTLRKLLIRTANCREDELSFEDKATIDQHLQERGQLIKSADIKQAQKLSAELNGIITYYEGSLTREGKNSQHILLATDTYLGRSTTAIIAEWLKIQGLQAVPKVVPDLSTKDVEPFRRAMSWIIQWCAEELEPQYPKPHWKVIFNLTGGFKSVNGFLQALAMFFADESIYIFESGSQILRIPRIPIQLDPEGAIEKHLQAFRCLGVLKQELSIESCAGIPETLLEQIDDRAVLSEWGELIWQKCWRQHYRRALLPPLSSRLNYSDRFKKDVEKLSDDRLLLINQRLDQLSQLLDSGGSYNPPSLDFKQLKGKPFKGKISPSPTHECDAWSDQDAKRLYGRFDKENYVVEHLGNHLKN